MEKKKNHIRREDEDQQREKRQSAGETSGSKTRFRSGQKILIFFFFLRNRFSRFLPLFLRSAAATLQNVNIS